MSYDDKVVTPVQYALNTKHGQERMHEEVKRKKGMVQRKRKNILPRYAFSFYIVLHGHESSQMDFTINLTRILILIRFSMHQPINVNIPNKYVGLTNRADNK